MRNPIAYFLMRIVNPALRIIITGVQDALQAHNIAVENRKRLKCNADGRNMFYCRDDKTGMWLTEGIYTEMELETSVWEKAPKYAGAFYAEEIYKFMQEDPKEWRFVRLFTAMEFATWKKKAVLEATFKPL